MPIQLVDDALSLARLCLDPNNPRLADLQTTEVADDRLAEESVQERALQRMSADEFEIDQLKESIRTGGYKTANAIVVIELPKTDKVRVIEGNRRVTALIMLKREADAGEGDPLSDELVALLEAIPVKRIEGGSAEERADYIEELLGTLHVPGTKAWGPYQQSQRVGRLLERGWPAAEIRSRLGLSQPRFTSLRRVYVGMKQMNNDQVFRDFVRPRLFSQFEEALSRPRVREWLFWDEDEGITDPEARQRFYSWITSVDEAGNAVSAKIVDAKDFRGLPKVLDDAIQRERFFNDPNLNLQDAADGVVVVPREVDWRVVVSTELSALRAMPAIALLSATDDDVAQLHELQTTCAMLLQTIELAQRGSDDAPAD